jgi:hypothetical protein
MAGYSKTPFIKKLGIKIGMKLLVINRPKNYWDLPGTLPANIEIMESSTEETYDLIHFFSRSEAQLSESILDLKTHLKKRRDVMNFMAQKGGKSSNRPS